MTTAKKSCICNRCGRPINKGDDIRFETYTTRGYRATGSGRHRGGGQTKYRPIHAHDCDGQDAAQSRAKAAAADFDDGDDHFVDPENIYGLPGIRQSIEEDRKRR